MNENQCRTNTIFLFIIERQSSKLLDSHMFGQRRMIRIVTSDEHFSAVESDDDGRSAEEETWWLSNTLVVVVLTARFILVFILSLCLFFTFTRKETTSSVCSRVSNRFVLSEHCGSFKCNYHCLVCRTQQRCFTRISCSEA